MISFPVAVTCAVALTLLCNQPAVAIKGSSSCGAQSMWCSIDGCSVVARAATAAGTYVLTVCTWATHVMPAQSVLGKTSGTGELVEQEEPSLRSMDIPCRLSTVHIRTAHMQPASSLLHALYCAVSALQLQILLSIIAQLWHGRLQPMSSPF